MDQIYHIVFALSVVNILGLLLLIIQSERRSKKFDEVLANLASIANRLTRIETQYEGVPDHEDLAEIKEQLSGIVTDVATINERWKVNVRQLDTIQRHLLSEDKA